MTSNQKGKDLLSKKMMAFGILFSAFVSGGLDPIVAFVFATAAAIFLSNIA
ncbi:hypothetical protein [Alteromonas macleodii]|uniref:hypothetical protein n=1 Tax=Alteromonas macleodii TaxID=28108 RepID=UPI000AEDEB66|nr:hypothetical protein [Alteromonas macleodii]